MEETSLTDLKQFIVITLSQQLASQAEMLRHEFKYELAAALLESERRIERKLSKKIDAKGNETLTAIAGTIRPYIDDAEAPFDNHEKRIVRREHTSTPPA